MGMTESVTAIGDILVEDGVVSEDQLAVALSIQEPMRRLSQESVDAGLISSGALSLMLEVQLANILVKLGYASEDDIFGPVRMVA